MSQEPELRRSDEQAAGIVRETYGAVVLQNTGVASLYTPEEPAAIPTPAIEMALGLGNPNRHAALMPGEVVLDLGSGGGIDAIHEGRAINPNRRIG